MDLPGISIEKRSGSEHRYTPLVLNAWPAENKVTAWKEKVLVTSRTKRQKFRLGKRRSRPERHPLSYQEGRLLLIKVGVSTGSHAGFTALNEGTGQLVLWILMPERERKPGVSPVAWRNFLGHLHFSSRTSTFTRPSPLLRRPATLNAISLSIHHFVRRFGPRPGTPRRLITNQTSIVERFRLTLVKGTL